LVEHTAENRGVAGSIPALAMKKALQNRAFFIKRAKRPAQFLPHFLPIGLGRAAKHARFAPFRGPGEEDLAACMVTFR
jgi:hypothetical protein